MKFSTRSFCKRGKEIKAKDNFSLLSFLFYYTLHSVVIYVSQVQRSSWTSAKSVCCEMALGAIALTDVSCRPAK
jgi:predicted membrane-bound mannosyltransferase